MSDYDRYRRDEDRFLRELDELEQIHEAKEWERRLNLLVKSVSLSKGVVLRTRNRLIKDAMKLRADLSEVEATAWVDRAIGLQPTD